jgi:hypothetical protein
MNEPTAANDRRGPSPMNYDAYRAMPFGKHVGWRVNQVPTDYLCWMLDNCENLRPWLREAARSVLFERAAGHADAPEHSRALDTITKTQLKYTIQAWYRRLAFEYHHDRGNDEAIMKGINIAHDRLKEALEIT